MNKFNIKMLRLGSLLAVLVVIVGFVFRNRGQCPDSFTQMQVDASDCIVGASIGPALNFKYVILVSILVLAVTLFFSFRSRK